MSASDVINSIALRSMTWLRSASISPCFSSRARTRRGEVSCCIAIVRISRSTSSDVASISFSSAIRSRMKCSRSARSVLPSRFCWIRLICRRISSSGNPLDCISRIARCSSRWLCRRSSAGGSSQLALSVNAPVICCRKPCCWWYWSWRSSSPLTTSCKSSSLLKPPTVSRNSSVSSGRFTRLIPVISTSASNDLPASSVSSVSLSVALPDAVSPLDWPSTSLSKAASSPSANDSVSRTGTLVSDKLETSSSPSLNVTFTVTISSSVTGPSWSSTSPYRCSSSLVFASTSSSVYSCDCCSSVRPFHSGISKSGRTSTLNSKVSGPSSGIWIAS